MRPLLSAFAASVAFARLFSSRGAVMRYRIGAIFALLVLCLVTVPHATETPKTSETLLSAASIDETSAGPRYASTMPGCRESAVYVEWSSGVASGVVEVESAYVSTYAGTWANLATVTFSGTAPKADIVQITGVHGSIRTRISTAISGGTVTTRLVCN